jgi:hypothetical protein
VLGSPNSLNHLASVPTGATGLFIGGYRKFELLRVGDLQQLHVLALATGSRKGKARRFAETNAAGQANLGGERQSAIGG